MSNLALRVANVLAEAPKPVGVVLRVMVDWTMRRVARLATKPPRIKHDSADGASLDLDDIFHGVPNRVVVPHESPSLIANPRFVGNFGVIKGKTLAGRTLNEREQQMMMIMGMRAPRDGRKLRQLLDERFDAFGIFGLSARHDGGASFHRAMVITSKEGHSESGDEREMIACRQHDWHPSINGGLDGMR